MTVNEIKFGNINRENLVHFEKETYLDSLLTELNNNPHPENESDATHKELLSLISFTDTIYNQEEILKRYHSYDAGIENFLIKYFEKKTDVLSLDLQSLLKEVHKDAMPILMKVKYHYQRIRPVQLAYYSKSELHPLKSVSADSPSYPSGCTFMSRLYCEVVGNRYPQYYKQLQEISTDMAWSRLYMGLNFPSDCDFGFNMAESVLANKEFKKKYKL